MEFESALSIASNEAWNRYHAAVETERYEHESRDDCSGFQQKAKAPTLADIIDQAKIIIATRR